MPSSQPTHQLGLYAGAASVDLTPQTSVFLFGYPHVPRMSTGIHDRLAATALYLRESDSQAIFIATDLIFIGKRQAFEARLRLSERTGVPFGAIVITATHTHSGPVMVDYASNMADPVVPKTDPAYLNFVVRSLVEAGCAAVRAAVPAEAGLAVARAEGVGTNRHNPAGPADPDVPVLLVRSRAKHHPLACMIAYAMHTTVLHEDSTLISGDFPHFTRQYLRDAGLIPEGVPILYHNGASGNQSPRHVTRANTFAEAKRLGDRLGASIAAVIPGIEFKATLPIRVAAAHLPLEVRQFPSVAAAEMRAHEARARFDQLRASGAAPTAVRTAECDWFGAEETVSLARAAAQGELEAAVKASSPLEIVVIALGNWKFVFWPGEFFVEYALDVKSRHPHTFVVTFANGEVQGYIVTPEAETQGVYEATNALFSAGNGRLVVDATNALLQAVQ